MAATAEETARAIADVCRAQGDSSGGYRCSAVSWDDVCRDVCEDGMPSCIGKNITDTRLRRRDGSPLFTLRSDNWNERLGIVDASDVMVAVGRMREQPARLSLRDFLRAAGEHGGYAGLADTADLSSDLDSRCSVRFQTTFLPLSTDGSVEFAPEAYSYQTASDDDPRNLVLLCTSQGVAVQQSMRGRSYLLHHVVDEAGLTRRTWLEAEQSGYSVGGPQQESLADRASASACGRACAQSIGISAMGQRFNALITVQVPLLQTIAVRSPIAWSQYGGCGLDDSPWNSFEPGFSNSSIGDFLGDFYSEPDDIFRGITLSASALPLGDFDDNGEDAWGLGSHPAPPPQSSPASIGTATAARLSCGSEVDIWPGMSVSNPQRHPTERITVTVVLFHTVAGGVPSSEDVKAAIDELEDLYSACRAQGQLADMIRDPMNF